MVQLKTTKTDSWFENQTLDSDAFSALSPDDLNALARAILCESKQEPVGADTVTELGTFLQAEGQRLAASLAQIPDVAKMMAHQFGEGTAAALKEHFNKLDIVSERFKELGRGIADGLQGGQVREMAETLTRLREVAGVEERSSLSEVTTSLLRSASPDRFLAETPKVLFNDAPERITAAAEHATHQLTEVAQGLAIMGTELSSLSKTFVGEAMPIWMSKLEDDRKQAKTMLIVTLGTVVLSSLVSVGVAVWQVNEARRDREEGDKQQQVVVDLMRQQLAETTQLQRQAADDAQKLRQVVGAISAASGNSAASARPVAPRTSARTTVTPASAAGRAGK